MAAEAAAPVRRALVSRALGATALIGGAVAGWALLEAEWYVLRRYQVPVLPAGTPPVRVLHISDLHLVPSRRRRVRWVRSLASCRPHLVVNTGDNLAHADALGSVLEALEPLLEGPGAFVTGSNDYHAPVLKSPLRYLRRHASTPGDHTPPAAATLPGRELTAAFRAAGWVDLDNRRGAVEANGVRLDVVGTADAHLMLDRMPEPAPREGVVRIGVTHAPYRRVLEGMRTDGCEVVFAGHTHGGQVCLPGVGALTTNCDLDRRRASGLHPWPDGPEQAGTDPLWLHVSAGLGTSPYTPVRLACRPEAALVELVARA